MALILRIKRSQEEHQHRWHPHIKSITNSLRKFWSILEHKPTTNRTKSIDQHGYYTLFDPQITKRKTLAIRKLLTQATSSHSTLLLSFDPSRFSNPPPAPSFYLDQPYPLYWDIAKELRPDSILQIVCQSAEISEGTLAITAHPSRQNAGVIRRFRVETLAQDFEIVLPQTTRKVHQRQEDTDSTFAGSAFLAQMPSWAHRIILKADPEDLTRRLLPAHIIPPNALHVATCFWAWLCVIDDLTEDGDCFNCIEACIETLSTVTSLSGLSSKIDGICLPRDLCENSKLEDCKTVISAFHDVVSTTGLQSNGANSKITAREVWKADFWLEVLGVVQALQAEKSLQGRDFNMKEWLELRFVTISARPFFVLLRVSLGLPPTLEIVTSPRVKQMQILVQAAMGLQNDLLGWQKDHVEGNALNAVGVLIRYGLTKGSAFTETLLAHNDVVRSLLCLSQLESNAMDSEPQGGSWRVYLAVIVSFCKAMAEWMLSSRRYRTEEPVVPGLFRLMYHDSNDLHEGVPQV